jgi:hypothetical protein
MVLQEEEVTMELDLTHADKTLALLGLLAEAKVKAKEVYDLECQILGALVEHTDKEIKL